MVAGKGIEHIGIADLEGESVTGAPDFSGIGDIHDGVVTAATYDLNALVHRNEGGGIEIGRAHV